MSLTTSLLFSEVSIVSIEVSRKAGPLLPLFAVYFLLAWGATLWLFITKWRAARGQARAQLQYLGAGISICSTGGIATNLLFPLLTGRSTYSWVGPYFALAFVMLVAHAIIRHRLMDLRLVIHQGLTLAIATLLSLLPVAGLLALSWPRLSRHLQLDELVILLVAITIVALLVPPIRDVAGRLLDRYVYRTRTNYRAVVREASKLFTSVLNLPALLSFVSHTVAFSTESEGVVVYLRDGTTFRRAAAEAGRGTGHIEAPEITPASVVGALFRMKDLFVTEEVAREAPEDPALHDLNRLNWAVVLPLVSEDTIIGLIALGPKLSGDAFYPQDIDLLMTLGNQASIAIKNAQLYAQVVLANEYIENIVATIESGVVAVDSAGRVTMFNRKAEQLTGLPPIDEHPASLDSLPAALVDPLTATLADGQPRMQPEVALPHEAGARPVICITSPLRDPSGVVLGAVAVFSDLTPLKELETERRRAERLAYFETLASGIAHEIKNPLVAIKTFAQLIPRRRGDEAFVEDFSRVVTREIGRMERLVERLRTLSRPGERARHPVDLRAPLSDALEFLKPAFEEKRIAVRADLGNAPRIVLGDHGELEDLFLNLLMNAHEATPPDGSLAVDVTGDAAHVTVAVADTGPGIPPELLERIFDPFFTTKQRGSGLGLAICTGIAAAHQAQLHATNRAEGGARFTLDVPLLTAAALPVRG